MQENRVELLPKVLAVTYSRGTPKSNQKKLQNLESSIPTNSCLQLSLGSSYSVSFFKHMDIHTA